MSRSQKVQVPRFSQQVDTSEKQMGSRKQQQQQRQHQQVAASSGGGKTIVFIPFDAHGHTNAMLGLADALKARSHEVIFVCQTNEVPARLGHKQILVSRWSKESKARLESPAAQAAPMQEQQVFCDDQNQEKWNQLVDLTDFNVTNHRDPEVAVRALANNFSLLAHTLQTEVAAHDRELEDILLQLRPDLVVVDQITPQPPVHRLANEKYARSLGLEKPLVWATLCSCNPMSLYYMRLLAERLEGESHSDYERRQRVAARFPPPLFGLPVTESGAARDALEVELEQLRYERAMRNSGVLGTLEKLAMLAKIDVSQAEILERFMRNESSWLNIYMYPRELDYSNSAAGFQLPSDSYLQVDSLTRSSGHLMLAKEDELLLGRLAKWKRQDEKSLVIYVSLGSTISSNPRVMRALLEQILWCLRRESHWHFAVSLGSRADHLPDELTDQLFASDGAFEGRVLGASWWPQPEMLRRSLVDVCVTHGGNNTLCELFQNRVKHLVVIGAIHDQVDNARRVSELRMGVALSVRQFGPAAAAAAAAAATPTPAQGEGEARAAGELHSEAAFASVEGIGDDLLHKAVKKSLQLDATCGVCEQNSDCDDKATDERRLKRSDHRDARYCAQVIEAKLADSSADPPLGCCG